MSNLLFSNLGIVCSACDVHNPPLSKRCLRCSAPLLGPLPSPPKPPPPVPGSPVFVQNRPGPAFMPPRPIAASIAIASPAPTSGNQRFILSVTAGPSQGQQFRRSGTAFLLGRNRGAVLFPDDPFISAVHATFTVQQGKLFIRDESTLSGTFVALKGPISLQPLEQFSAGSRLFRLIVLDVPPAPATGAPTFYGAPASPGRRLLGVEELLTGGRPGRCVVTEASTLSLGKAPRGDLSFPLDGDLADKHCELTMSNGAALLKDTSGGLGTFIRIPPAVDRLLVPGDRLRVGQQTLTVEI